MELWEIKREVASTNINLCSLYSTMGKHEISLTYVEKANKLLGTVYIAQSKEQMINPQLVDSKF